MLQHPWTRRTPEVSIPRTKDLFQPYPPNPDAPCWRARGDELIVFLNGEKPNSVWMEHYVVAQNPEVVSLVLVIGTQRFQAALLVEPIMAGNRLLITIRQAELIDRIWPSIQEANEETPAHAQVEKALLLNLPGSLLRASRGRIQRAASIAQYRSDINVLYANADIINGEDDGAQGPTVLLIDMADPVSCASSASLWGKVTGRLDPVTVLEEDRGQEHDTATSFDCEMGFIDGASAPSNPEALPPGVAEATNILTEIDRKPVVVKPSE